MIFAPTSSLFVYRDVRYDNHVRPLVGLLCIAGLVGCRIGFDERLIGDGGVPDGDASVQSFMIGGTASGLTGPGLVLQNNGTDDLEVPADGEFSFATPILDGQTYAITVRSQPASESCSVSNAQGTVAGAPITDVEVTCFGAGVCPPTLTFTSNGSFTLPTGCTGFTVDVTGGGGAGVAKAKGIAASAGGAGGQAIATFAGETPGTTYDIVIGRGGVCGTRTDTLGGYTGGGGGKSSGFGDGTAGAGTTSPPGGAGGAGSIGGQPGGAGGNGGFGGGGGGGGGDVVTGSSGGGATTFRLGSTDYVVAGGGGAAGASDQNGDIGGAGGAACNGTNGVDGQGAIAGTRSGGGGGGGACFCLNGCDGAPTSTGGAAGVAGDVTACTAAQNGGAGRVVITFP